MKHKLLFIINPIAGTRRKNHVPALIDQYLDAEKFDYKISFTTYAGQAKALAHAALEEGYDAVVAVGGDGTINEIGNALLHSQCKLGIIPFGSGNGLARHLGIPMDTKAAIQKLNHWEDIQIDAGQANEHIFFCTAGLGFDAWIGKVFADMPHRGLSNYVKAVLKEYRSYQPSTYQLKIADQVYQENCLLMTFANTTQWGNNAHIAPQASVEDGMLDLCIIRSFPLYKAPKLGLDLFGKKLKPSTIMEYKLFQSCELYELPMCWFHTDGEVHQVTDRLHIKCIEKALRVII
ncbi:diacylglycerol/lipid kinase family protein [Penaeicola halotolerans]|uniref:diacylglycerol/lipid kinase family protein n=1 Tax=Penaeicola halotolerans TaxID=2793196 RepID=UPI001CF9292D|nr:diacylglycerol kinase family protein [Penaeicola halotolerans]